MCSYSTAQHTPRLEPSDRAHLTLLEGLGRGLGWQDKKQRCRPPGAVLPARSLLMGGIARGVNRGEGERSPSR